jgi:hypothetical protein
MGKPAQIIFNQRSQMSVFRLPDPDQSQPHKAKDEGGRMKDEAELIK